MKKIPSFSGLPLMAFALLFASGCGDSRGALPNTIGAATKAKSTASASFTSSDESSVQAPAGSSSDTLKLKFVNDSMTWGSKYDSVSGGADQGTVCVDIGKMGFANDGKWQQGNVTFDSDWKVITDAMDLSSFFKMNAHAKASVGVYGASVEAGAAADAKFSASHVYGSYHIVAIGWTKALNSVDNLAIKDFYLAKHDNFADFINECGDYYLHQVQTGAELLLLTEIKATDVSAAASLSAGFSVAAQAVEAGGSLSAGFSADYANSEVDGHVYYSAPQGCGFTPPVVDPKDFTKTVQAIQTSGGDFTQKVTSSCLEGSDADQTPAYLTTFRKWTQDAWQAQRQDWVNRNKNECPGGATSCAANGGNNTGQVTAISDILDAFDQYQAILGDLDSMSLHRENYDWSHAAYQYSGLPALELQITGTLLPQVKAMAQACGADPANCQWQPISPSPQEIRSGLPVAIALPSSCADVVLQGYGLAQPDGVYPLYVDRKEEQPLCVYCYGMTSGDPQEFLKLYKTSPAGKTVNNYSVKRNMYYHDKKGKHVYNNMVSTFNYLPITSLRHGAVTIDAASACNNYQDADGLPFAANWFSGAQSNNPVAGAPLECVPYGTGTHYEGGARTEQAKYNVVDVNVAGHPLYMDSTYTKYSVPSNGKTITYANGQGATLQVQSGDGQVSTFNDTNAIQFQYNRTLGDAATGLACAQ